MENGGMGKPIDTATQVRATKNETRQQQSAGLTTKNAVQIHYFLCTALSLKQLYSKDAEIFPAPSLPLKFSLYTG